jgi:4-diphosphocytidyl-2C-methyl-D-erythritol kinase
MNGEPPSSPASLRLLAPAKINLHLRVGPPTPDGFHPLLTWMCTVALFDTIDLSRGTETPSRVADSSRSLVELTCDDPSVPCDATNLIAKIASALAGAIRDEAGKEQHVAGEAGRNASASSVPASPPATREGRDADGRANVGRATGPRASDLVRAQGSGKDTGDHAATPAALAGGTTTVGARLSTIKVVLHKRIPAGAGLGGGSSDGARAMLGIARLWNATAPRFDRRRLADLAARCGSDLPFFFHGPSSACTGRGQFVRPVPAPTLARWAVLVLPAITMPTPAVYRTFDEMRLGYPDRLAAEPDWSAWANLPSIQLLPLLVNDLETPAFALRPDLAKLREQIESQLARPVRMSGSGSSLFTLFDAQTDAQAAAQRIGEIFSVRTVAVEVARNISDDLGD